MNDDLYNWIIKLDNIGIADYQHTTANYGSSIIIENDYPDFDICTMEILQSKKLK